MNEVLQNSGSIVNREASVPIRNRDLDNLLTERVMKLMGHAEKITRAKLMNIMGSAFEGKLGSTLIDRIEQQARQHKIIVEGVEVFQGGWNRRIHYSKTSVLGLAAITWVVAKQYAEEGRVEQDWRVIAGETKDALGAENAIAMSLHLPQQTDGIWPILKMGTKKPSYSRQGPLPKTPEVEPEKTDAQTSVVVEPIRPENLTLKGLEDLHERLPLGMEPITSKYIAPELANRIVYIASRLWPEGVNCDFENMKPAFFRKVVDSVIKTMRKNNVDDFDTLYDYCRRMMVNA